MLKSLFCYDDKINIYMQLLITTGLFFPAKLGGPANTLFWLSKALVKKGVYVSVVATNNTIDSHEVPFDTWANVDGIRARYCKTSNKISWQIIYYSCREMVFCDVVMLSSICFLSNFPVAICATLKKKRLIWSPRGELLDSALHGNRIKLAYFKVMKLVLGNHVTFHATSQDEKDAIHRIFGKEAPVAIIPNYMELPSKEDRETTEAPYLIYVGRIAPIKALDKLIEGIARSESFRESDIIFKIVGGVEEQFREYYRRLQELVSKYNLKDKILFLGPLNGKAKFQAYANAQFTFLLSNSENFGNVVIESLSQGTPVVASKGTPWNSLIEQQAGFWIDNSPEEIAKIIDSVISMPEQEYSDMRENAFRYAQSFDIYSNVGEWLKLLSCKPNVSRFRF